MKIYPYKHKEKYIKWKEEVEGLKHFVVVDKVLF